MLLRGLQQQARFGLATLAILRNIVRTKINTSKLHSMAGEDFFHPGVDVFNITQAHLSERYTPLIGNHEDFESRSLEIQSC